MHPHPARDAGSGSGCTTLHASVCIYARQKAEAADKWHEPASRHALAEQTAVTKVGAVNDPLIRRSIHAATPHPSIPIHSCTAFLHP